MSIDARQLIKRANESFESSERSNFNDLWNSAIGMCRPEAEDVYHGDTAGEKKRVDRYIDTGVQSLDSFTSGMTSTLIPKGSKFFEFTPSKTGPLAGSDEYKRWLLDCSRITLDYLNESNFFSEAAKALSDLGVIGTALLLTEPCKEEGVKYKTFYINRFAMLEDSNGKIDTVFFKLQMTARQLKQKFGEDKLGDKQLNDLKIGNDDNKHSVIQCIYPRSDFVKGALKPSKFKFANIYLLEDEGSTLLESGFPEMPASVCRWIQSSNEIYGRSPAMQAQGDLAMVNQMEYTKLKSAQRIANPQWLLPDDGSVRNLNNQAGGIVYYNATNQNAKPEQIAPRDMPNITDAYQEKKIASIEKAFHLDVWNPLQDVTSSNASATEIQARMSVAKQSLVPKINRVIDELLEPTFKRTFQVLYDGGNFPQAPSDVNVKNIKVNFLSSAGLILRQIESVGTLQTLESLSMMAQVDPTVFDYIDTDAVVKQLAYSNAVPTEIIKSDYTVKQLREVRAKQQEQQQAQQQMVDAADVYNKTTQSAQAGSPAEMLQQFG